MIRHWAAAFEDANPVYVDAAAAAASRFGEIVAGESPHRGELHPDGDELLFVITGRMDVIVDDGDEEHVGTETIHRLGSGDACIVPRGTWHRIEVVEPGRMVNVTPGPGGGARLR